MKKIEEYRRLGKNRILLKIQSGSRCTNQKFEPIGNTNSLLSPEKLKSQIRLLADQLILADKKRHAAVEIRIFEGNVFYINTFYISVTVIL